MTLPVPDFLHLPDLRDPSIRYRWDDWGIEAIDMPIEPELQARLHMISQRAVVAFTIGAAEWAIYRLSTLFSDTLPRQYLESAWAQLVDFRYGTHHDINLDDWRGPVRGPVGTAIRRVKFADQQAEINGEPAWRAGRMSKLVEHLLPDKMQYLRWRDRTVDRFTALYPYDPDETLGEVVPWQFSDPDRDAQIEDTEQLINAFLKELDYTRNPFLSSPENMIAAGFTETPYTFILSADRRNRFEW